MQQTHQSYNPTQSVEGVMLTLALCHCLESLSICECVYVIEQASISRWISYDLLERMCVPILFMISSALLPGVFLATHSFLWFSDILLLFYSSSEAFI